MVEITTPEVDSRQYRYLQLPNGLKVVLVSEFETYYAAASLSVNVGHYQDPEEVPGLAHFLEHMLFMGTEKYPDENEYHQFLSHHGGGSNAYTDDEYTNYFFSIHDHHLEGGLDRFAQFFISPLLNRSSVEREMKAVDAEHSKNLQDDGWREFRISGKLHPPHTPPAKFGTGNLETLNRPDIYDQLMKFYRSHYSANLMTLTLYSGLTLDEMEEMVTPLFSQIPNHNTTVPPLPEKSFREGDRMLQFLPVRNAHLLSLRWIVPNQNHKYRLKLIDFWSHLLGHEGEGGLYYYLKENHLIEMLIAGLNNQDSSGGILTVDLTLTTEGLGQLPLVVGSVVKYLEMLRGRAEEIKTLHQEMELVDQLKFRYLPKTDPEEFVVQLSQNLHKYPPEDVVYAPYRYDPFGPDHLEEWKTLLQACDPSRMGVTVGSQLFASAPEATWEEEKWYRIKYRFIPIPEWTFPEVTFRLPKNNPYLPDRGLQMITPASLPPMFIPEVTTHSLWCQFNAEFHQPRMYGILCFHHPELIRNAHTVTTAVLLRRLLEHQTNSERYYGLMGGMSCTFHTVYDQLSIKWESYRHQYPPLLKHVVERIMKFTVTPELLQVEKENLLRDLSNTQFGSPIARGVEQLQKKFVTGMRLPKELEEEIPKVTPEDLTQLAHLLLQEGEVTTVIVGDIEAQEFPFFNKLLPPSSHRRKCPPLPQLRTVRPSEAGWKIQMKSENPEEINNGIILQYRIGYLKLGITPGWNRLLCCLEVLELWLKEPFFDQLRTKEQLGYLVNCSYRVLGGERYPMFVLQFIIQSPNHPPEHLSQRIYQFIEDQLIKLKNLPEEKYLKMLDTIRHQYEEEEQTLFQKFHFTADQIINSHYQFNYRKVMAETCLDLPLAEFKRAVVNWFQLKQYGEVWIEAGKKMNPTSPPPKAT